MNPADPRFAGLTYTLRVLAVPHKHVDQVEHRQVTVEEGLATEEVVHMAILAR